MLADECWHEESLADTVRHLVGSAEISLAYNAPVSNVPELMRLADHPELDDTERLVIQRIIAVSLKKNGKFCWQK